MNSPSSTELLIADTSPLLALARVDLLYVLSSLFTSVVITESVWLECIAKPDRDDARRIIDAVNNSQLLRVNDPIVRPALSGLDRGEQTALELALTRNSTVLLDEKRGRAVAKIHHIKVIGALGVLLLAKRRGVLNLIGPIVLQLKNSGYFLDESIIEQLLKLANE